MQQNSFKKKRCHNGNNCKYLMYSYCPLYHYKNQCQIKCPLGLTCYRIKYGKNSPYKCPFIHNQSDYDNTINQIYPKVQCDKLTKNICQNNNCQYYHSDDNFDIHSLCLNFSNCPHILKYKNSCRSYHLPGDATISVFLHILKYSINHKHVYYMNLICESIQLNWNEICKYIKCLDNDTIISNSQLYDIIVDNIYIVSVLIGQFIDHSRCRYRDIIIIENYNKLIQSGQHMVLLHDKTCDCCNDAQEVLISHTNCLHNICINCFIYQLDQSKLNGSISADGIKCVFCKSYSYSLHDLRNIANVNESCDIQSINYSINEIESINNTIIVPSHQSIINNLVKLVELSIITSHCPKCDRTFHDNDACRLVTCTCGIKFCAYCQKINANHWHVANCQLRPINTNDTFSSEDAFYVTRNTTIGIRLNSIIDGFWKIYGSKIGCSHTIKLYSKLNAIYNSFNTYKHVKISLPWKN